MTLGKSTRIKARAKSGSTWSALSDAVFAVGSVAENIRITEIMYHPPAMGDPEDPNKEFIELKNIGPDPVNLNLVAFTNGIDFTFRGGASRGSGRFGADNPELQVQGRLAWSYGRPGLLFDYH